MPALMRSMTELSASVVTSPTSRPSATSLQQPAHDLARARLRQLGDDHDLPGLGDRTDLLGHVVAQLLHELGALAASSASSTASGAG